MAYRGGRAFSPHGACAQRASGEKKKRKRFLHKAHSSRDVHKLALAHIVSFPCQERSIVSSTNMRSSPPAFLAPLLLLMSLQFAATGAAQWEYASLPPCVMTSLEMANLSNEQNIEPCILHDEGPEYGDPNYDMVVQNVQVTPTICFDNRDGAPLAIEKLNSDNDGEGFAIGFNRDYHLGFRLISIVAGNPNYLGNDAYLEIHTQLLRSYLNATKDEFRYIIGSCSWTSSHEKPIAGEHEAILLAQVGPPGFYTPENSNPWVFGLHLSSDDYPLAAARKLAFQATQEGTLASQPVRVIYRSESEFFFSTCASAISALQDAGFQDIEEVLFEPEEDEDGDGTVNSLDADFLEGVADQICPPGSGDDGFEPAIFMCTLREQNFILPRFRQNGCRPYSFWITSATWDWWTGPNIDAIEDFQGGGQWHPKLSYSDRYFESGVAMLEANENNVGYVGGYDMVVSYTAVILNALHLQQAYRVFDTPTLEDDIRSDQGKELLRRRMLDIRVETLFGPIQFDDNQRNFGRGSAASQWQPDPSSTEKKLYNALVSPDSQAESEVIIPSPTALPCKAGYFQNTSILLERTSLLQEICDICPVNTYTPSNGKFQDCLQCPEGTTTEGFLGATNCTKYDDNLLSNGMLSFGYIALAVSWIMAIVFLVWIFLHREDPVVRLAQTPYLVLICIGGIISSSSILGITFQAGTGEDDNAASIGCTVTPILYSVGWVIQYGSLCAKTLRLKNVVDTTGSNGFKRRTISVWSTSHPIIVPLVLDIGILLAWTLVDPLQYVREEDGRSFENGVMTIESIGRCRPSDGDINAWAFLGPLLGNHIILVLWTHWLLYKVRNVNNRYQEQKYLGMAAIFALEVAVVGIPILIAAQDSVEATFFVISGIVALDNIGVLCFVFVPKVMFQRKGLEEGVTVSESVLHATHQQALARESSRKYSSNLVSSEGESDFHRSHFSGYMPSIMENSDEVSHEEDGRTKFSMLVSDPEQAPPLYKDTEFPDEANPATQTILLTDDGSNSPRATSSEHLKDEPEESASEENATADEVQTSVNDQRGEQDEEL